MQLAPLDWAIVIAACWPRLEVAGVREAIAAAGARLVYLPPYSPLNKGKA